MRFLMHAVLFVGMSGFACLSPSAAADTAPELQKAAKAALAKGDAKEAVRLATQAIEQEPKNPQTHLFRGMVHEALQQHVEAVADFDKAIALDPRAATAYDHRGSEQFKLGRIKESIADFDKYLELKPDQIPHHWKRGISYYYAGRFDEGRKQFEGYEKVDTNDVENAVWHYLCLARQVGAEKARQSLLKIGNDKRVPMMQVYELFAGKIKPADVLTAARAGTPTAEQLNNRLFYAHLYLGLYYEAVGDAKQAQEQLAEAVKHRIGHYMWDVASVHLALLKKTQGKRTDR